MSGRPPWRNILPSRLKRSFRRGIVNREPREICPFSNGIRIERDYLLDLQIERYRAARIPICMSQ